MFGYSVPRSLRLQAGLVGVAAFAVGIWADVGTSMAVLFGGLVSVANSSLLVWRWHQGARDFHCDAAKHLRSFYRSAMERFFVVVILLAVGFILIRDHQMALLVGFVVGQLGWLLGALALRERN